MAIQVGNEWSDEFRNPNADAPASSFRVSSIGNWPDYYRCVLGAPADHGNTGPHISRADFFWAKVAAQRNHGPDEIRAKLLVLSSKAKENGMRYTLLTAQNAVAATERRRRIRA
jgi:hypothetical protein